MNEQGTITTSISDGIAKVSFFHPQSNSLPGDLLRKLAAAILEVGNKSEARVIILKSEGDKAFCAGASFDELVSIKNLEEGKVFFSGFAAVINAIRTVPVFVIARVHGKAVGGGVGLASAADLSYATLNASVKLSELAVGIGPFVVGPAVERKIGTSAFSQLSINATEWKSSEWAREKGLFAEVFETETELDEAIQQAATKLAASSPDAIKELKAVLWKGTENWNELLTQRAEISGRLVLSEFTRNAIQKFKAK